MQIVKIQALPRENFPFRPRAGRFFPSGQAVSMEIVDDPVDPTVEEEKVDGAGKKYMAVKPHPSRMSRKVYEEKILTDPILRVLSDGETASELSQAALDAARKQASELAGELVLAKSKLAASEEQVVKLNAAVDKLAAELAEAKASKPADPGKPADDSGTKKDDPEDVTTPDSPSAKARTRK